MVAVLQQVEEIHRLAVPKMFFKANQYTIKILILEHIKNNAVFAKDEIY